mgnify:CR=1 FL=1
MRHFTLLRSPWLSLCVGLLLMSSLAACSSTESASDEAAEPAPVERPAWDQGNDTYLLRLAPESGATYETQHTQQIDQTLLVQGNEIDVTQDQTITQELRVANYTAEGVTTLESTITRMQVNFDSMGNAMSYDSDAEDNSNAGPLSDVIGPMVGKALQFELDQQGEFVGNPDTLAAQVDSLMGDAGTGGMSDPSMLVEPLMSQFRFYPSTPVAVGDSWDIETELDMGVPFTVDATYTLDEVNDAVATIDIAIDLNTDGSTIDLGQIEADAFLSGTQTGTLTLDLDSGLLQSMEQSGSISGFAEFTPPNQNEPIEMDMDINSTVSFQAERMTDSADASAAE